MVCLAEDGHDEAKDSGRSSMDRLTSLEPKPIHRDIATSNREQKWQSQQKPLSMGDGFIIHSGETGQLFNERWTIHTSGTTKR